MKNPHFLPNKPNKPNFHKNLNVFFSKYPHIHIGNMLFINDTPCKIMFNRPYSAIFLEFFDSLHRHNHYLLGTSQNFIKTLMFFFSKYPYIHIGNMLYVDDTPCKIMFNMSYNAIFLEIFYNLHGHNHYLLGIVPPYLEYLHSSRYGVSTFVHHNPFNRIKCMNHDDPRQFKMLFVKCSHGYKPSFCNNAKLKLKQKVFYNFSS